jgi:methylenetetrahydrofolate reductase (NADPH)
MKPLTRNFILFNVGLGFIYHFKFFMNLSFEFFPPKTLEGLTQLLETAQKLQHFRPEYFSVTYGAGGNTQDSTLKTIMTLQQHHLPVVPHISCIGSTQEKISELLHHYQQQGIKGLVALRGDLPSGAGSMSGDFHYARDLVAFIRATTGTAFNIFVAAYPECHPQAGNLQQNLQHFKQKVAAGATAAITQYFYHPDAYFHFVEACRKLNIDIPIIPGIMPLYNFSQLARFSEMCGAEIPRYMRKQLETLGDDIAAIQEFGIEVVSRLCRNLLAAGAPGLHFIL